MRTVLPVIQTGNRGGGFLLLDVWFSRMVVDNETGLGFLKLEVEWFSGIRLGP